MTILVDGWCLFSALYVLCLRMVYCCNIRSVPTEGNMQDLLRYLKGVGMVGWSRDTGDAGVWVIGGGPRIALER